MKRIVDIYIPLDARKAPNAIVIRLPKDSSLTCVTSSENVIGRLIF